MTFGEKIPAYDPAVVFGVNVEVGGSINSDASETLVIAPTMLISSKAEADSLVVMQRIQRYRRVLMKVALDNFDKFPNFALEIAPNIGFTEADRLYYALGVIVKTVYPI